MSDSVPIPYEPVNSPIVEAVKFGGLTFKTVTWKVPSGVEYKGKLIYVHGFSEHSSLYTEFFDKLSRVGYEIFFFDQRGAGETSPGKLEGITDEHHTFNDLDFMIKRALDAREDKNEKFYLGGHSMGGGIVLNYGIKGKYRENIRAIFACGPLVKLHPKTQPNVMVRAFQPVINKLVPKLTIDSKLNYDYITSHEGWKDYIKASDGKLIGSVRQFNDMFVRGEKLLSPKYASQFSPEISVLVFHGTDDNINHFDSSKRFYESLPDGIDKEFFAVENGRHSLFIESEAIFKVVFDKVESFLNAH